MNAQAYKYIIKSIADSTKDTRNEARFLDAILAMLSVIAYVLVQALIED